MEIIEVILYVKDMANEVDFYRDKLELVVTFPPMFQISQTKRGLLSMQGSVPLPFIPDTKILLMVEK